MAKPSQFQKVTISGKAKKGAGSPGTSKSGKTRGVGAEIVGGRRQRPAEQTIEDKIPDILLSVEECNVLKQVVFRNHQSALDPLFFKVAQKEVNSINKIFARNIELCLYDMGPKKSCKDIIKENMKEYKGLIKTTGHDSPTKKLKDLMGPDPKPTKQSTQAASN